MRDPIVLERVNFNAVVTCVLGPRSCVKGSLHSKFNSFMAANCPKIPAAGSACPEIHLRAASSSGLILAGE